MNLDAALSTARKIARQAGDFLASRAGYHAMEFKGPHDPVTALDRESEKMITESLRRVFPDHGILAEEGTRVDVPQGYSWVIDPLDGTTNYAHALPYFSVSMGLVFEGHPVAGVIYAPILKEEFHAWKGGGAFRNGERIGVSREKSLDRAFLVTGEPYSIRQNLDYHIGLFKKFVASSLAIRRFGSACLDLCNVACGKYDGYWEAGLKPWDAAAGILIVEEAGGKVADYQGNPYVIGKSSTILASNGLLHDDMLKVLSS